jgi:cysteine desulfurase
MCSSRVCQYFHKHGAFFTYLPLSTAGLMSIYLDCNATTPIEPVVQAEVLRFLGEEVGNAGSRTHEFGHRAKQAVERAREQVARVAEAEPEEVVFTSGATESNNLALLGLAPYGEAHHRRHIVSTQIEHKAVLEPLQVLENRGFEIDLVPPTRGGWVEPDKVMACVRPDTLAVSVMHVNNETGISQPITEIAERLQDHPAYFHVDAAQGFGKDLPTLRHPRIDLISISAHKVYGPKGVGALITRFRDYERPPLTPLVFGGGQERGLRAGTLPVPLIVGLGKAAEEACLHAEERAEVCRQVRTEALEAFTSLGARLHGDSERGLPHVLNISFPGIDSEALMLALRGIIAISNGSACTSSTYTPSHVLQAMELSEGEIQGAVRISWCHLTPRVDWAQVQGAIQQFL